MVLHLFAKVYVSICRDERVTEQYRFSIFVGKITVFILSIRTPYLRTTIILKFEQLNFTIC